MSSALPSPRNSSVILVTQDEALVEILTAQLGPAWTIRHVAAAAEAETLITTQLLKGAVIDMASLGRQALALARTFLRCQPVGRVVLVAAASGPETLMGMALRDRRVDCLYRPFNGPDLRECLLPTAAVAR